MICYNPEQAERDAALSDVMLGKLTALIDGTDALSDWGHGAGLASDAIWSRTALVSISDQTCSIRPSRKR